jgi:hypothetical protein
MVITSCITWLSSEETATNINHFMHYKNCRQYLVNDEMKEIGKWKINR